MVAKVGATNTFFFVFIWYNTFAQTQEAFYIPFSLSWSLNILHLSHIEMHTFVNSFGRPSLS